MTAITIGKSEIKRKSKPRNRQVAILAFGTMVYPCVEVGNEIDATVVNMRFVKPLDENVILNMADSHSLIVTVEEHVVMGGAGSAVNECLNENHRHVPVLNIGIPDVHLDHGTQAEQHAEIGLDIAGIQKQIEEKLVALEVGDGDGLKSVPAAS